METILQVQKGAPVDLLVGTDVLFRLGFTFSRLENNGKLTYLLGKSESGLNVEVVKEATKSSAEPELARKYHTTSSGEVNSSDPPPSSSLQIGAC